MKQLQGLVNKLVILKIAEVLDIVGVTCDGATECTWLFEDVELTLPCRAPGVAMFENGVDCEIVD